jgi:hypothetical protein
MIAKIVVCALIQTHLAQFQKSKIWLAFVCYSCYLLDGTILRAETPTLGDMSGQIVDKVVGILRPLIQVLRIITVGSSAPYFFLCKVALLILAR